MEKNLSIILKADGKRNDFFFVKRSAVPIRRIEG